jgi:PAS domain S-box-containing protein
MKTSLIYKISLVMSGLIMMFYFGLQSSVVFEYVKYTEMVGILGYACFLGFVPFFLVVVLEFLRKSRLVLRKNAYLKKLNDIIISQSHNTLFYEGKISDGGKLLTKEVAQSLNTDRCSIWLYNKDKTSIKCQHLYVKSEDNWHKDMEILKSEFEDYFNCITDDPIIVIDDVSKNDKINCFKKGYLSEVGVKSMLDVPIILRGSVIGIICIESLTPRPWEPCEIDFAQMISSLYSFAYSVKEGNKVSNNLLEFDKFVDSSVIVTKTDKDGNIIYINKRFEEVSEWRLREIKGKKLNIVSSGEHSKMFWKDMFRTTVKEKKIWHEVVTNKTKDGDLYYIDTYIKADFDEDDDIQGFMSIG